MSKRTKSLSQRRARCGGGDDVNQTKCWIATSGHSWMRGYFDTLPLPVRRRLQGSPFNLCPACLVTKFLPQVRSAHSEYSHQKALFAAIEVMESEVRKERKR
jgi:hypothetical protein